MYKCMKQGALHNDHKQSIHIKITHIQSKHRKLLQREREWLTNTTTQKMRWGIIYTTKCLHSLVYNTYVHN